MENEKLEILKMIESGKITAEEGVKLLSAISKEQTNPNNQNKENTENNDNNFNTSIEKIAAIVNQEVKKVFSNQTFKNVFNSFDGKLQLEADVKNGNVLDFTLMHENTTIIGYEGNKIFAEIFYRANVETPDIQLINEQNVHKIMFKKDEIQSIGCDLKVPFDLFEKIYIKSSNATIEAKNINSNEIKLQTSNANVILGEISSKNLTATSSNGKIELINVSSEKATATTSNAKIDAENTNIAEFSAKTSNAKIQINNYDVNLTNKEYNNVFTTSNAKIVFIHPENLQIGQYVIAKTSNAKVSTKNNFEVINKSKNTFEGKSAAFESSEIKFYLNATTSNAKIEII